MTDPDEQLTLDEETETFHEWILRTRAELGYDVDRCADVHWHDPPESLARARPGEVGDHVWNPKEGRGHVLNAQTKCSIRPCGGGCDYLAWTDWDHVYAMCECGEYEPCDQHNILLRRRGYLTDHDTADETDDAGAGSDAQT